MAFANNRPVLLMPLEFPKFNQRPDSISTREVTKSNVQALWLAFGAHQQDSAHRFDEPRDVDRDGASCSSTDPCTHPNQLALVLDSNDEDRGSKAVHDKTTPRLVAEEFCHEANISLLLRL
ncbi:hypothetical protein ACLOJK_036893 [Asimina triloba]